CPLTDFRGKTSIFSHPVYLFLRKFSLQDSRGGSATFFGPDRHFEDYWQQPAAHGGGRQRQVDVLAGLGAMSDKFGKSSNKLTF
ncbi:hypothetical protein, partial [Escherichia coli]